MKINLLDLMKAMDTAMASDSFHIDFEAIESAAKEERAVIANSLADPTLSEQERQNTQRQFSDVVRVIFYCSILKLTLRGMTFEEIHLKHFSKIPLDVFNDNYIAGKQLFLNRYLTLTGGR